MKDINQTSNLSNKQTVYLNICLKIIVVSVIMLPMIQFVELGVKEIRSAAFLINNKEILKNQIFINGVNEVDDKDLTTVIDDLKIYFNEKDAIYQDFFQNEMEDDSNKEKEPYLIVNKNYLKQYNILDENGIKLNYDQLENNTLLIPEKYKSIEISDYCDGQTCNVIFVKNGMVYKNRDPMTALNNLYYKKDPIILLKNSVDSSCKWSYPFLLLEANKSEISHIRSDLDKKGLLNAVELESTDSRYEIVMEEIKDNCLYLIPLFFVYIFVVLTFLYQNIYIYFINNKEMFALKYLFGNSFFERHGKMILVNISVYVLPLLYGLYYQKIKLIYLFIFIALAILFELISAFILIKRFEKNRTVNVLKGE